MPFPPKPELKAWILDWLDEEHPECPSGVDVIVGLLEDLGYFLEARGATEDESLWMVALCLTAFLDDLTPATKGLSGNYRSWPDRRRLESVVPVAVKAMPLQAHGGHLRVGDGDTGRILAAVEFGAHAQP